MRTAIGPSSDPTGPGLTRRTLLATALSAAPTQAIPAQLCPRTRIAELPLRLVEGYPIVPATIAGQAISLLLDTGAQGMLLTPFAAQLLNLPLAGMTHIYGTGGGQDARVVRLVGLRLGDAAMPELLSPVAPLPLVLPMHPPLAGLLGAALLARFDLDLDIPAGRMALWLPATCPAPPTATPLFVEISRAGEAFLPVRVNGQTLLALLDTGSRATLLTHETARRLHLEAPLSANTAPGIDGERLPLGHLRVQLAWGDDPPADTPVSIAPLRLERGDMLLGLDQLGRQPFWLSYANGTVAFRPRAVLPCAISDRICRAAAAGSAAPVIGRPTTR